MNLHFQCSSECRCKLDRLSIYLAHLFGPLFPITPSSAHLYVSISHSPSSVCLVIRLYYHLAPSFSPCFILSLCAAKFWYHRFTELIIAIQPSAIYPNIPVTPSTSTTTSASFVAPSPIACSLYLILCLLCQLYHHLPQVVAVFDLFSLSLCTASIPLSHGIHYAPFLSVHSVRDFYVLPLLDHPSFSTLRLHLPASTS